MRLLVSGPPRSGTTWVAEALAAATGARYVHEPDNPDLTPLAWKLVETHGLCPVIGESDPGLEYETVWSSAFRTGWDPRKRARPSWFHRFRPAPKRVVAKSVNAGFSLGWVVRRYHPQVVLVRRNPLNIIASWLGLGWRVPGDLYGAAAAVLARLVEPQDLPRPPAGPDLGRLAWWTALMLHQQEYNASRHSDWVLLTYEEACLDPRGNFAETVTRLGLEPSPELDRYLSASSQPGEAVETERNAADPSGGGRNRLDPGQLDQVATIFGQFPSASWKEMLPPGR